MIASYTYRSDKHNLSIRETATSELEALAQACWTAEAIHGLTRPKGKLRLVETTDLRPILQLRL